MSANILKKKKKKKRNLTFFREKRRKFVAPLGRERERES